MGSATAHRRHAAQLCEHRHRGTDRAGHAAPAARPRARRRIRRRGNICRRARARRAARALHELDSNDRHPGLVSVAAGDTRAADHARYGSVRGVGMAHTVPAVDRAARRFGVHPAAAPGIAGVPGDQARGQAVQGAAHRVLRALVQSQDRAARAVRRDCGSGGRLVRRAVLLAVLPGEDPEGRCQRRKSHHCGGADHRHAVLHRVRRAVGPHRAQEGHHGRLRARGTHLLPAVQGADVLREPGARSCRRAHAGHGGRRSVGMLVPVRSGGQEDVQELLRHREIGAGPRRRFRISTRPPRKARSRIYGSAPQAW